MKPNKEQTRKILQAALAPGSAARASAARMEDALRQIEDIVGRCVSNPGLESNVVEMVEKLAQSHERLKRYCSALEEQSDSIGLQKAQHIAGLSLPNIRSQPRHE